MTYRVKNWHKFQHFKDRRPPWIKLYREILDDPEWHELDGESAKMLTMIWLVASEDEGGLPSTKKLAFRLRVTESKLEQALNKLSHWLERDDIGAISACHQDDAPEREGETETEKEGEKKDAGKPAASPLPIQKALENWNLVADTFGLARVRDLTDDRREKLRQRLRKFGLAKWNEALEGIESSKFLRGENDRHWKITFDWLVKPSNFIKVLEGAYVDEPRP